MNYVEMINLALVGLNTSLKLIAELKAQSGMTDEQLLDLASQNNAETRSQVAAYIASINKPEVTAQVCPQVIVED